MQLFPCFVPEETVGLFESEQERMERSLGTWKELSGLSLGAEEQSVGLSPATGEKQAPASVVRQEKGVTRLLNPGMALAHPRYRRIGEHSAESAQ
jgi:hypothetical protein